MRENNNSKDYESKSKQFQVCRECGIKLTDENWCASYKKGHSYICKRCKIKQSKEWQQNNGERYNQTQKIWRQNNRDRSIQAAKIWQQNNRDGHNQSQRESRHRLRNEVIDAYGGKCACCGETRKEFLSIDHKNGNGNKQKKEIGARTSQEFYCWLKENNYPDGFQVLCFNCNCGKGTYSVCPYDKDSFEEKFEAKLKKSYDARYAWALRMDIIKGYGGKCELCGEDNPHFLTIDHVNGGGSKEKKILGNSYALYRKLRDENYPRDNYRLLCYNCNCALGFNRITEDELIKLYKQIPEKKEIK